MKKKKILYLGLDPSRYPECPHSVIIHWPMIQIDPRPFSDPPLQSALASFSLYTHLLFTSRSAVKIFFDYLNQANIPSYQWMDKTMIAVGKATASLLEAKGVRSLLVAQDERAEGVIEILKGLCLEGSYLFWPHSSGSRVLLTDFLSNNRWRFKEILLYATRPVEGREPPSLDEIEEIIFTSPSTVDAFIMHYGSERPKAELRAIGEVTRAYLAAKFSD